ncbi:hypothetical protein TNIN_120611 [Trichonephila inaurata madagascariensis]|uniref:Uncharacterized protein n=1 Tax=Trichonephila inaurata madagascariensis TaxID=2747483 RepID=A0A8X6Y109_9ARAC|nr:hypothetical protein TNIN_120611 [Trichonephila inaurata madagascariensis]
MTNIGTECLSSNTNLVLTVPVKFSQSKIPKPLKCPSLLKDTRKINKKKSLPSTSLITQPTDREGKKSQENKHISAAAVTITRTCNAFGCKRCENAFTAWLKTENTRNINRYSMDDTLYDHSALTVAVTVERFKVVLVGRLAEIVFLLRRFTTLLIRLMQVFN